jgi:acyl carrier protein
MNQIELITALGKSISENLSEDSTTQNSKNWDSLGHLSILTTLSKVTDGRSDLIPEISNVQSIQEILLLLGDAKLLDL